MERDRMTRAMEAFDAYNASDPHHERWEGQDTPKELLYAQRMSEWLERYHPGAPEHIQLAARCQHIGRWEIPRDSFPMNRKGYLLWRNKLKFHHAEIAERILADCGYNDSEIEHVQFLIMKKQLATHPDTQLLEDVICLVFVRYYLDDFAAKHPREKVNEILQKTMKKMSPRAVEMAGEMLNGTRYLA